MDMEKWWMMTWHSQGELDCQGKSSSKNEKKGGDAAVSRSSDAVSEHFFAHPSLLHPSKHPHLCVSATTMGSPALIGGRPEPGERGAAALPAVAAADAPGRREEDEAKWWRAEEEEGEEAGRGEGSLERNSVWK